MEQESFEDDEVAELLNRYFIAIKVDREERPDVDHLYMEFCQALTGSGGWPLTIFMTPDDKKPFFTGTYFPKQRRYGRAGLIEILNQIGELWRTNEKKLRQSAEEIFDAVTTHKHTHFELETEQDKNEFQAWTHELIQTSYNTLHKSFDPHYGGFGSAPKFPSPHNLTFLLRYSLSHPQEKALKMVRTTLDMMGKGGVYDHIGYGFSRYSTDEKWLVPHFEKMLYDNALLAIAYLECYQLEHQPQDEQKAREIFSYVLRDMTSPEGGFYSAEDADSEGEEGKFYVWTPEEIRKVLSGVRANLYCEAYDITEKGNFEGKNIPNLLRADWEKLAMDTGMSYESLAELLDNCRKELFFAREKRIHPYKDDKILTSWNGLMIVALAKGAQILNDSHYAEAAENAAEFLLNTLYREQRLLARYRDGEAAYLGYLDDYAFLIWGLLELYMATGSVKHLQSALMLQNEQERLFLDKEAGGYYLTGSDAEELLIRPKEVYDGAMPSGNSISALNLLRIARLTGDEKWERRAEEHILAFRSSLSTYPSGYNAFLQALQFVQNPNKEIILAGNLSDPELIQMKKLCFSSFKPYTTLLYQEGTVGKLIPWVKDYPTEPNKVTAYVCENFSCHKPVHTATELAAFLE